MRGRFWRKVIIKRGNNVAYPQTNDSFRATENRPGIKYDPAKKTTLFAEDLKALGDSIISIQNAVGNFNLKEQGAISNRVYEVPWNATILQHNTQFKIKPIFSKAIFIKGFVKMIAYYKAPDIKIPDDLYINMPAKPLHKSIVDYYYELDAIRFMYRYDDGLTPFLGRATLYVEPIHNKYCDISYQKFISEDEDKQLPFPAEIASYIGRGWHFYNHSTIKLQMEYLADGTL